ncbi:MAG: hypothetical protein QOI80_3022 [Solirubrobacteraceae bacterium]|nr:hypothetical protein [Solirubrobacteraceae bacterium]
MIAVLAHALVQREDIPLPPVVFAWSAAAVLVISFVGLAALWPQPRLEANRWRPVWRVPGALDAAAGAVGVALLAVVIWAGFAGEQNATANIAPTLVYVIVWVGMAFASLLFGDLFRAVNPWRALGRLLRLRGTRPYPERLGRWPAALGLLFFTWTELVAGYGNEPDHLAVCAVLYTLVTLGAMAVYGTETWVTRGEAFGVYFGLFARLSVLEVRDGRLGRRPLLGGLPHLEPMAGTVALVAVMIGTVTFDGLLQGSVWRTGVGKALNDLFDGPFGASTATYIAGTIGLIGAPLLIAGFYRFGIAGAESVGGGLTAERLRGAFLHSLVPIALVYVMAHYLSFLVFQGQGIYYLASDPLGHGWNLFGTANSAIDYGLLSQNAAWYLQVGFVVLGHVAGLVLAHDRALVLYEDPRAAVRSQYWMLSIMVGFTSLALWLLSQANPS